MRKYVLFSVLIANMSFILCDLNKTEGAECQWGGVKGICVKSRRCLTTLDIRSQEKHPVCSRSGAEDIICCTDCELVNDTRNAVITPTGVLWQDGRKYRDQCLRYLKELPYKCKDGTYGITKELDEKKQCHGYKVWNEANPQAKNRTVEFPYQVRIGFGGDDKDNIEYINWAYGGTIISDRYILTTANTASDKSFNSTLRKFIAGGIKNNDDTVHSWQITEIKRVIIHPEYRDHYNDLALIETKTPIPFNENILPACLPTDDVNEDEAFITTARIPNMAPISVSGPMYSIKVQKHTTEECSSKFHPTYYFKTGFNSTTQMCYGSKEPAEGCTVCFGGDPLVVKNHMTSCVYTVIGISTFCNRWELPLYDLYEGFDRVAHYVPWIESVVWP